MRQEALARRERIRMDSHSIARSKQLTKRINAYIDGHLNASLTARDVCAALSLPYETTCRRFRADFGLTLNQHIKSRLLREAARRLLSSDRTVREIASGLGFSDEFYFSRLFRQKIGHSPRAYRRVHAVPPEAT